MSNKIMKLMLVLILPILITSCNNTIVRSVSNIKITNQIEDFNKGSIKSDKVNRHGKYQYDNLELDEELGISYGVTIDIYLDKNVCIFEVAGTQVYDKFKCKVDIEDKVIRLISITDNSELASIKRLENKYMIQTKYTYDNKYHLIDMKVK